MVSNPRQHIFDVSFAVNNGDDLQRLRSAIHDHVLIYAEEQHAATCKVATFVSFARKVAQASERVNQFILNSVSYRQAGLFEKYLQISRRSSSASGEIRYFFTYWRDP